MFQKILTWIREVLAKMLSIPTLKQGLQVDVAITPLMTEALQLWSAVYKNESPWLTSGTRSLNLGAAIASEVARDVTIEMDVQVSGSARADFLAQQFVQVLNNIRTNTEYASAKGGLVFKPYIKGDTLAIDYVQADMFYPIAFDANGKMTACVFADQKTIGQSFYTRLEFHSPVANGYRVANSAWKSTVRDMLGAQIPLTQVPDWAELEPEAFVLNIDRPLFAYFKMPFANNIDPQSPLGVSIYSRATQGTKSLLQQADEAWTGLLWEMESGERAVYTTPDAFGKGSDGKPVLPNKRLYRLLDLAAVQLDKPGFFHDWTPTMREQNYINALDAILRRIEFVCGLSYGILSNPEQVALTATEIKSSKQRYYATVTDTQKGLQDALDNLLYAMDVWCTLGNLATRGTYKTTYQFDDSIVSDYDTQFVQDQQTVTSNAMPKYIFLMRNYGLSEEEARKWIAEATAERPAPISFFPPEA
jgi:A118 family predicted phage portal protein